MFLNNKSNENALNGRDFITTTTTSESEPLNAKFYAREAAAARKTEILGWAGQVVSAITEFTAIAGALSFDPRAGFTAQNLAAVFFASLAVYLFEIVGVRVYLVSIIRQAVSKDIKTPARAAIFALKILFAGALLAANFYTSIQGVKLTADTKSATTTSAKASAASAIESDYIKALSETNAGISSEIKAIEAATASKIEAIEAATASQLKDLRRAKWAKGANVSAINNKITEAQNAKAQKIDQLLSEATRDKEAARAAGEAQIKALESAKNAQLQNTQQASAQSASIIDRARGAGVFLLIVFLTLSTAAIIYTEIFKAASGIEQKADVKAKRPNLFFAAASIMYERIYHTLYTQIARLSPTRFNYARFEAKRVNLYPDQLRKETPSNTPARANYKDTSLQIANSKSIATQNETSNATQNNAKQDAKREALERYKITTVQSWYKRSNLVERSESATPEAAARNAQKYIAARDALRAAGVQIIETPSNVSIKL